MNQTEIPNISEHHQNVCTENLPTTDRTFKNRPGLTTVFSKNQNTDRLRTPKLQHSNNNSSSHKLSRNHSSKGIKIVSSRPSSTDKCPQEFSECADIKSNQNKEQESIMLRMREELLVMNRRYQQKMNQQLVYQYNSLSAQINRLRDIITNYDQKLGKKEIEIIELTQKYEKMKRKTEARFDRVQKQIDQLKQYYGKCYEYTLWRVNDIDSKVGSIFYYVNEEIVHTQKIKFCNQIPYLQSLIQNIITTSSSHSSAIKVQTQTQLSNLTKRLKINNENMHELDLLIDQMKYIKHSNEGMSSQLTQFRNYLTHKYTNSDDGQQGQLVEEYEGRYEQILRRVNGTCIQVQLIRQIYNRIQQESILQDKSACTISELSKIINQLQQQNKHMAAQYDNKVKQLYTSYDDKIRQIQAIIQKYKDKEEEYKKQIQDKDNILQQYCKKQQRQKYIKSSLIETFSQDLVREKTKELEEQNRKHNINIKELTNINSKLNEQNNILASKICALQQQIQYKHTHLHTHTQSYQQKIQSLNKHIYQIEKQNKDLKEELNNLQEEMNSKTEVLERLTQEMQGTVANMSKMAQVKAQNAQLKEEVQTLQNDLHQYATTFENQSVIFRNAIEKLQSQKDQLVSSQHNHRPMISLNSINRKINSNRTYSFTTKQSISQQNIPSTHSKSEIQISQCKYNNLKNALEQSPFSLPVICSIDETGYLKYENTGQYIVDKYNHLFTLTEKEIQVAIENGLLLI